MVCGPPSSRIDNRWFVGFPTTYALERRRRASWMEARVTKVARVSARFSKSLARRRFRPNHEKVRSTIQRRGRTTKAFASLLRLTICVRKTGTLATAASTCQALYRPSAQINSSHGKRWRGSCGPSPSCPRRNPLCFLYRPLFRRFHRLAVENRSRRAGPPAHPLAQGHVQLGPDRLPHFLPLELAEDVVDRRARRKAVTRQVTPRATGAQQV